jgi:hypothetical protein
MANYPASLDNGVTLPNPTGASTQNNPDHAGLHTQENNAIIALENKVGVGASTPAANRLLFGTAAGVSSWSQLTSVQLAASISDPTGSGAAVFANTPTLITPKVDTINESTVGNGVTVGGVNLKAGVVSTANSVGSTALATGGVTATKIGTDASFAWVDYAATSTLVGWASFTNKTIRYTIIGKTAFVNFALAGSSNSTLASFTLPFNAKAYNGGAPLSVDTSSGLVIDSGTIQSTGCRVFIDPNTPNTVSLSRFSTGFTASGNKDIRGILMFETV